MPPLLAGLDNLAGRDGHAGGNDRITYPEDHEQLKALLGRRLSQPAN